MPPRRRRRSRRRRRAARALRLLEEAPAEARRAGTAARRAEHRGVARRVGSELVLLHPHAPRHVAVDHLCCSASAFSTALCASSDRAHRAPRHLLQALRARSRAAVLRHPQRGVHQLVALERLGRHHQLGEELAREQAVRRAQQVEPLPLGEDDGAGGAAHCRQLSLRCARLPTATSLRRPRTD